MLVPSIASWPARQLER